MPKLPPRRLPWDVLLLVFKEADPSTLAVLGGVSMDFLASTAPMLYRDVEVSSMGSLNQMFCERERHTGRKTKNSSAISRINPHLDLDQIQTLSIDIHRVPLDSKVEISSSRIHQSPLLLDNLRVSYGYYGYEKGCEPFKRLYNTLFQHLNPLQCAYFLIGRPTTVHNSWFLLDASVLAGWTRIQDLKLAGAIPYSYIGRVHHLGGLPYPSLLLRRTVRLYVASFLSSAHPTARNLPREMSESSDMFRIRAVQDGSLVLVVGSEEEKKEVEAGIQEVEQKWRSRFAVELET